MCIRDRLDGAIVAFSFYFALLLRADGAVEASWWPHNRALLYANLPWIVAVYLLSFLAGRLYTCLLYTSDESRQPPALAPEVGLSDLGHQQNGKAPQQLSVSYTHLDVYKRQLDQPQRTDDVLGGGEVFAGGQRHTVGVVVAEHDAFRCV